MLLFSSVKNWLTVLILGLVALAMLAAWAYAVPPLTSRLDEQKLADQRTDARLVSDTISAYYQYYAPTHTVSVVDSKGLRNTMSRLGMRFNARIVVLASTLVSRYDTGGAGPLDVDSYPMIEAALTRKAVAQDVTISMARRYAATAVPLIDNGTSSVYGVVLVLASLRDVDQTVAAVQLRLMFAMLIALGVSLALGYMASFFIAGRLKRIERSAEAIAAGDLTAKVPIATKVAAGDLTAKVPIATKDEIGQLASTFNIMADRLTDAFAQIERERDRAEVLLNDLSEGVIGVSGDGTVMITNPAAAELLGAPVEIGSSLEEAVPADVMQAWREARREGAEQAVVTVQHDRTLEATAYAVADTADFSTIVVVHDITSQARLQRARRDLIANASHEFETPLFSLAGFLELIDEGNVSAAEQREFIQLMRQQVDRLRNLAISMLDLSRVEAGAIVLEPEFVELKTVARSVLAEFQAQAQTKNLHLAVDPGPPVTAWCDEQRLAQVLRALVDNAVKFSPPDSRITVKPAEDDEMASIVVMDDGPGIAAADLPHVFERFHRGREERATTAGTGLGLSIARELVEMMGGHISVSSRGGHGTSFTVSLPRAPRDGVATGKA